jgi:hypothetical protein
MSQPWVWIAIVAIVCWAVVEVVKVRKGVHEDSLSGLGELLGGEENGKLARRLKVAEAEIDGLRERVAVLERLATDGRHELDREFERLRREA